MNAPACLFTASANLFSSITLLWCGEEENVIGGGKKAGANGKSAASEATNGENQALMGN
ncbi:hypothetical protein KC799_02605 [candidate division KSB1 bacterium]|nr:hypothetical protein [candidate division KSB1 bacterium]